MTAAEENAQNSGTGNWGRWGPDDERGALNLIDGGAVLRGVGAVKQGRVLSLGLELGRRGLPLAPPRQPPVHLMTVDGGAYLAGAKAEGGAEMADSYLITGTQVGTHMDALAHIWDSEQMYNGFSRSEVRSTSGARRLGIENVKGIVTRGIFFDIPRDLGRERMEAGFQITDAMLADSLARSGLALQPGDAVLIRTGFLKSFRDGAADVHGWPGLNVAAGRYLARNDVAVVVSDNLAIEAVPWDTSAERKVAPVHLELIRDHGVYFIEGADLEGVAAAGARELLFMAAPLPIKGGTGSPTNPLVVY